jgi:hypothetical protein
MVAISKKSRPKRGCGGRGTDQEIWKSRQKINAGSVNAEIACQKNFGPRASRFERSDRVAQIALR